MAHPPNKFFDDLIAFDHPNAVYGVQGNELVRLPLGTDKGQKRGLSARERNPHTLPLNRGLLQRRPHLREILRAARAKRHALLGRVLADRASLASRGPAMSAGVGGRKAALRAQNARGHADAVRVGTVRAIDAGGANLIWDVTL